MHLNAAVMEFFYSKDFTADSKRFYRRTLDAFQSWAERQGATTVEDITSPLPLRTKRLVSVTLMCSALPWP